MRQTEVTEWHGIIFHVLVAFTVGYQLLSNTSLSMIDYLKIYEASLKTLEVLKIL